MVKIYEKQVIQRRRGMAEKLLQDYIMHLKELGLVLDCDYCDAGKNSLVKYVSYNSMDVKTGTLFICKGKNFKEEYLESAIEKGAFCYVAEKRISEKIPAVIVSDMRKAMSEIGMIFYDNIWNEKLKMVGITGTKGKSTTASFLKAIMDEYQRAHGGRDAGFISGIYNYDGCIKMKSPKMTTPETLQLHKLLADCAENGCRYLIMETSSQALKYERTAALKYEACAFLNIAEDHISDSEHRDFEDYFCSKLKIFEQSSLACINADIEPEYFERIKKAAEKNCRRVMTFGETDSADYYGYDLRTTARDIRFKLRHPEGTEDITVSIGGAYNISNALAAISLARALDVPFENIKRGLSSVKVSGRMEIYSLVDKDVDVIVDYAHNKLSYQTLLKNIKQLYPDRKIMLVSGCVGGKAHNRRKELADVINNYVDKAVLTEQYPGNEPVEKICREIKQYISSEKESVIIPDRDEAVAFACQEAENGWVVIAAGSDEDRDRVERYVKTK